MVPPSSNRISRVPSYSRILKKPSGTGLSPCLAELPSSLPLVFLSMTGLVRFRSPRLAESRLMSFPLGTEMVQFPRFASPTYEFSERCRTCGGFPHSEICGSRDVRSSPQLIATFYVLLRLSMPRHPLNALSRLILFSQSHSQDSFKILRVLSKKP